MAVSLPAVRVTSVCGTKSVRPPVDGGAAARPAAPKAMVATAAVPMTRFPESALRISIWRYREPSAITDAKTSTSIVVDVLPG